MTRSRAACLGAVAALAIAGCGKSDVEKFADDFRPLDAELTQQKVRVAATLRTVKLGSRRDAQVLEQQVRGIERIRTTMAELDGPDEVETAFQRFLDATKRQSTALGRVAAALGSGDRARLRQASAGATESESAVRRASDALREILNRG